MINQNDVQENLKAWLENPFWAEYYNGAPSDRCREFIALEFYCSEYGEDEAGGTMDAVEETLDVGDLRYLFRCCGNNPRRGILARRIAEREMSPGGRPDPGVGER